MKSLWKMEKKFHEVVLNEKKLKDKQDKVVAVGTKD